MVGNSAAVYGASHGYATGRTPDAISKNLTVSHEEADGPDTSEVPAEESQFHAIEDDKSDDRPRIGEVDFSRRDGTWEVYTYYTKSAGPWVVAVFVISVFVWTFLSTFSSEPLSRRILYASTQLITHDLMQLCGFSGGLTRMRKTRMVGSAGIWGSTPDSQLLVSWPASWAACESRS